MPTSKKAGLTQKQENFALFFVQTANAAEAYRRAYDVADDAKDSWIYVEAFQLLDHPKIAPRIEELKEKAKERSEFTVFKAIEELEEARTLAMGEAQASAAVSATNSKVKLLGLDKPRRVEVGGIDGKPIQTEEVSPRERIASKLSGLAARAGTSGDTGRAE